MLSRSPVDRRRAGVVGDPGRSARQRRVVSATGNVALVYGIIGVLTIAIAAFFRFFTALGDAQRYVDERNTEEEQVAAEIVTA